MASVVVGGVEVVVCVVSRVAVAHTGASAGVAHASAPAAAARFAAASVGSAVASSGAVVVATAGALADGLEGMHLWVASYR